MRQLRISQSITNRDSKTLEKYFNEVSKEDLLTPEQEVELARRIKYGDRRALEKLVRANLRFVVSVAKQYQHSKVPLNDLINEGNIGLVKAAQKFDETKGFKFISYAVWWIRQSIMQALADNSRFIRIPVNKVGALSKIKDAAIIMEQRFEREPTAEELADFLNVSVEDIKSATDAVSIHSSLDAPFVEGESNSLIDVLENDSADDVAGNLEYKGSLRIEIERLLVHLTEREREVIKQYFGIGCESKLSLEDIGSDLGLTRERVRQIKEKALVRLRHASRSRYLETFIQQ